MFQVTLKNGNKSSWCGGSKINVQINGFKKDSINEPVTCEVGQIHVNPGQEGVWNSDKRNLGTCSDVVFDTSVGKEPKFQIKVPNTGDGFCPKSVELKINDIYFCGKPNYNGSEYYRKRDKSTINSTIKGRCL